MLKGFAIMNDTVCGIRDSYRDNDDKLQNVHFDAVHQLSGTNCRKLFPVVTLAVFKHRLKTFLFSQTFSSFSAH